MSTRQHTAAETPQDLLNDLRNLVIEAEKMMENSVSEHSQEALEAMRTRFAEAQERFSDLYESTRKKVIAGARYTDQTIRENPYQSLAIAAGVGVLVGVLLGRRSR